MAEFRNRTGGVYALTTFASILPGHKDELQAYLDAMPEGSSSPLARLSQLHLSRIHIFDELVAQPGLAAEKLDAPQLVFTSSFDGSLDRYCDDIAEKVPEADDWWGHCVGYPGRADKAAFRAYIRAHKIDTQLFANAYHGATVQDVLRALENRRRVIDFAVEAQALDAAELQERFRSAFAGAGR
jgi:hypothetical protein